MTRPHYLNGRILLREPGGVRRYAREVAARLPSSQVVMPRSATYPWSARLWEQTTLAKISRDGVLLNIAHSGPLRHPRHVMVVHDLFALTDPASVRHSYTALLRWQLPRLITGARSIVAVSHQVADALLTNFGVASDQLHVVPPGISAAFVPGDQGAARTKLGLDPDQPVIAALLDPTPRKNAQQVVAVLHEVARQRPELQVVVAGQTRSPAFARRKTTNAASRAGFFDLGPAADIELATMYQAADVVLSLTRAEGFGLPQVEAANCGAAVVTTRVPSISETAPHAALLVTNPAEAIAAITGLLQNADQRGELAAAAADALGDLQWARTAATLEGIMSEVGQP